MKAGENPRTTKVPQRRSTSRCCRPRCAVPRHGRSLVLAVDTNVLVYVADADSQFHTACRNWLERQRPLPNAWYTTWAILYEFLRVTTHRRVMRRPWSAPAAWNFVAALLASPGLSVLSRQNGTPTSPKRLFWSCRILPVTCSTTRTPLSLCVNTASDEFAPATQISINFRFSR
jgi:hypothetical protein